MFIVSLQEIIVVISFGRFRIANPREAGAEKNQNFLWYSYLLFPWLQLSKNTFFGGDGAAGV